MTPSYTTSAAERRRASNAIGFLWASHRCCATVAGLSMRTFQAAVYDLVVLDGEPILSSGEGFKRTTDAAELRDARERLRHRASEILRRARALGRIAAAMDQIPLPREAA